MSFCTWLYCMNPSISGSFPLRYFWTLRHFALLLEHLSPKLQENPVGRPRENHQKHCRIITLESNFELIREGWAQWLHGYLPQQNQGDIFARLVYWQNNPLREDVDMAIALAEQFNQVCIYLKWWGGRELKCSGFSIGQAKESEICVGEMATPLLKEVSDFHHEAFLSSLNTQPQNTEQNPISRERRTQVLKASCLGSDLGKKIRSRFTLQFLIPLLMTF